MLKPIGDNIVLQVIKEEALSAGGIVLPGSALEKPYHGKVVAANKQFTMPDGSIKQAEVFVDDLVVFGKSHGTEVKHEGEMFLVISEEFILCKEQSNA
jgi:chaperonin GroES